MEGKSSPYLIASQSICHNLTAAHDVRTRANRDERTCTWPGPGAQESSQNCSLFLPRTIDPHKSASLTRGGGVFFLFPLSPCSCCVSGYTLYDRVRTAYRCDSVANFLPSPGVDWC